MCKATIENPMSGKDEKHFPEVLGEPYKCVVCSTPDNVTCFNDTKCTEKISSTTDQRIPMYNNLFEFRVEIFSFKEAIAAVKLSTTCYLRIHIRYNFGDSNGYVEVQECSYSSGVTYEYFSDSTCDKTKIRSDSSKYALCAGVAIGLDPKDTKKAYYASVFHCYDLASKQLNYQTPLELKKCVFTPNEGSKVPSVRFRFIQELDLHKEGVGVLPIGVPVILPCSPGGNVVSPYSGKFLSGASCDKLYRFVDSREDNGISFIISKFYDKKENLEFPKKDYKTSTNNLPIYINDDAGFTAKSVSDMKHTEKGSNKKRSICTLT
ncbi:UNVERIFIED_CONTAM: hypothetical protein RMT77_015868 [Armadillidium vulgare]